MRRPRWCPLWPREGLWAAGAVAAAASAGAVGSGARVSPVDYHSLRVWLGEGGVSGCFCGPVAATGRGSLVWAGAVGATWDLCPLQVDNAYWLWTFQGRLLQKNSKDRFCQLLWRPRPPTLLSQDQIKVRAPPPPPPRLR